MGKNAHRPVVQNLAEPIRHSLQGLDVRVNPTKRDGGLKNDDEEHCYNLETWVSSDLVCI